MPCRTGCSVVVCEENSGRRLRALARPKKRKTTHMHTPFPAGAACQRQEPLETWFTPPPPHPFSKKPKINTHTHTPFVCRPAAGASRRGGVRGGGRARRGGHRGGDAAQGRGECRAACALLASSPSLKPAPASALAPCPARFRPCWLAGGAVGLREGPLGTRCRRAQPLQASGHSLQHPDTVQSVAPPGHTLPPHPTSPAPWLAAAGDEPVGGGGQAAAGVRGALARPHRLPGRLCRHHTRHRGAAPRLCQVRKLVS